MTTKAKDPQDAGGDYRLMTTGRVGLICGLTLFVYGDLAHLLLVTVYGSWGYGVPDGLLAQHYLTVAFITSVGAAYFVALMYSSVRRVAARASVPTLSTTLKGALFGALGTLATLQTYYVVAALALALRAYRAYPNQGSLVDSLVLAFIDIETYGLVVMAVTVPFGLCYGAVGGLLLVLGGKSLAKSEHSQPPGYRRSH